MLREMFRFARGFDNYLDISLIKDNFAIGAAPRSTNALEHLTNLGFDHIIDLRAERKSTDMLATTNVVLVHWVPIYDDWKPKSASFFGQLEIKLRSLLSNNERKVFMCCGAGEHRAPLGGLLALVSMGHPLDTAVEMIQQARPIAEFLPVYISSLKQFLETAAHTES